jgi:hypothetical protein
VDASAVRGVADRIADAADLIDGAIGKHLARLVFDGARAGRGYPASGDAVRAGLDQLAGDLAQWSRGAAEIAIALRCGVDRYVDAELYAASRIV